MANENGEYGMPVSIYVRPEDLWGYEFISAGYREDPADSGRRIYEQVRRCFPEATEKQLRNSSFESV